MKVAPDDGFQPFDPHRPLFPVYDPGQIGFLRDASQKEPFQKVPGKAGQQLLLRYVQLQGQILFDTHQSGDQNL